MALLECGFSAMPVSLLYQFWLHYILGLYLLVFTKLCLQISIQLVATQGFDPIIRVVALCSNMSQAAASLAVGLKTKNKKLSH